MSKLLLVEPDKMLRQAFLMALYPDFEVRVVDTLPNTVPQDADALIIDGAALPEQGSALKELSLAQWRLPILWIDSDASAQAPGHEPIVRLKRPFSREALRGALAQCLRPPAKLEAHRGLGGETRKDARRSKRNNSKRADGAIAERSDVIELVDVVEESTGR